jgi:O-antigen/teichoic acid export membrane protein
MSLKTNIFASYVSQFYVAIIGILLIPQYLKYMGAEAYGLVGFFSMLIAWFNLLDLGLTPTMARETARFRGGATDALSYRRFVRAIEGLFLIIALVGGGAMFAGAGYIANSWLQASQLPTTEVQTAIELMSAIVALRWLSGLYRGAVSGSERLVWLGGYNAFVATIRFIGVLPVLIFVGASPTIFFSYQLGAAALELVVLIVYTYRLLPRIPQGQRLPWSIKPIKPSLKLSLTIAFTSAVWVLVTQTDKLVLSKILPLAEYGYFTLAVLIASGVSLISGPINISIAPRLAKLEAENDHTELIRVYRQATQIIMVMTGAASAAAAFFAEPLLWAWTGDTALAHQVAPILMLYAIGNGFQAVTTMAFYLQYAKGDLRLHVIDSLLFVTLLIPTIIWAVNHYAAIGAGYVWLAVNLLNFLIYVPLVHKRFEPGLHIKWLWHDVFTIFLATSTVCYLLYISLPLMDERWQQLGLLIIAGAITMLAGIFSSSMAREKIKHLSPK